MMVMGFVMVVGVVVMGFVASCGCCCDGFCEGFFFFPDDGDGGGWLWVASCGFLFMVVAGEATMEVVEATIAVGLDFVVVVCHYFNELSILF